MEKYLTIKDENFKYKGIKNNVKQFDEIIFIMEKGHHCEGARWKKIKEDEDLNLLIEMLEDNDTPYVIEFH